MNTHFSDPGLHVLVVDDEKVLVTTLILVLRHGGFSAEGVHTGRAALDYIRDRTPQVVLVDLHLPDFDGRELARKISAKVPGAKIFMLTGDFGVEDDSAPIQLPYFETFCKPVNPDFLLARLRRAS